MFNSVNCVTLTHESVFYNLMYYDIINSFLLQRVYSMFSTFTQSATSPSSTFTTSHSPPNDGHCPPTAPQQPGCPTSHHQSTHCYLPNNYNCNANNNNVNGIDGNLTGMHSEHQSNRPNFVLSNQMNVNNNLYSRSNRDTCTSSEDARIVAMQSAGSNSSDSGSNKNLNSSYHAPAALCKFASNNTQQQQEIAPHFRELPTFPCSQQDKNKVPIRNGLLYSNNGSLTNRILQGCHPDNICNLKGNGGETLHPLKSGGQPAPTSFSPALTPTTRPCSTAHIMHTTHNNDQGSASEQDIRLFTATKF